MESLRELWNSLKVRVRGRFPELYGKLPHFARLIRLDRPIGIYLLLWPTLTALWIAAEGLPNISLLIIFTLGCAVMRSAGCCINDFADAKFDGRVQRTEQRPLATGALSRRDAVQCFIVLCAIAFLLVLLTNQQTILLSIAAVAIAALYPFMKRHTNLPQLVLGIAYSWGILMAFTAQTETIPQPAWLLFIANLIWTVAYDTEYAMVDREYDLKIGVKSTAILFGDADKLIIGTLQIMFVLALWLAAGQLQLGLFFYAGLLAACGLLAYQQWLIRDRLPGACFRAFLNNHWVGLAIFISVVLDYL